MHLLAKPGCNYLEQDDFIPFLQVLAVAHPGRGLDLAVWDGKIALAWVVQTGRMFLDCPAETVLFHVAED